MIFRVSKITTIVFLFYSSFSYGQLDKERVGNDIQVSQQGGFYNYGDKNKVNIDVAVWGFVKYPGKYLIPKGSTVQDLISYSGGPVIESKLEEIRLYRPKNDSLRIMEDKIITLNYNDLFWEDKVNSGTKKNPELLPGDILIFPGEERYFFRDNVNFIISIAAVLISLGN